MTTVVADKRASAASSTDSKNATKHVANLNKPISFNTYIRKILQGFEQNIHISQAAAMQIDMFVKFFAARLAAVALQIAHGFGKFTINAPDISSAAQVILPDGLYQAVTTKAEASLEAFKTGRDESGTENFVRNKAARCGLQFPPHLSEKILRQQENTHKPAINKVNVAQYATVYMAAVIEYIAEQVLTAAVTQAQAHNRSTINVRYLLLGTNSNPDLLALMNNLKIIWVGGGLTEDVHPSLIPSKEKRRALAAKRRKTRLETGETPTPSAARKALPGVRALREVRRLQKSWAPLQRREHFNRFIRAQADAYWGLENKVLFANGVIDYLQLFIEDRASLVCREAVRAMVHAGRDRLDHRDLDYVWGYLRGDSLVNVSMVGIENLAVPGLHRVIQRGGVKLIADSCYNKVREIMAFYAALVFRSTFILLHRQKMRMLTMSYLRRGVALEGFNLPLEPIKMRKPRPNGATNEDVTGGDEEVEGEEGEEEVPLPDADDGDNDEAEDLDETEGENIEDDQ